MSRFLVLLLAWLACATSRAAPLEIRFWHSMTGPKGVLLQEIVDEFNAAPGNRDRLFVNLQFVGTYNEGMNKLRTALLGGKGPHIAQIFEIGTRILLDSGTAVPLQDLAEGDPGFPWRELLPQIRRYYEIDGKLHSLPFATSNPILYCNRDMLERAGVKPPRTFEELRAVARRLSDPKRKLTAITWPLHSWFFEEFLARQGAELVDQANGRRGVPKVAKLASPEGVAFLRLWADLVAEGSFAHVGRGWEPAQHNFLAGRSAMLITSTSDVFEIAKQAPFPVVTAPLPGPEGKGGTIVGGNSLWVMRRKRPEEERAAYEFVRFMASAPVQEKWHKNTGYFPIRSDVLEKLKAEGFYDKHPAAWTAIEQLRAAEPVPATQGALLPVFLEAREVIESAIEQVLSSRLTVEQALAEASRQTERALARYYRGRIPDDARPEREQGPAGGGEDASPDRKRL